MTPMPQHLHLGLDFRRATSCPIISRLWRFSHLTAHCRLVLKLSNMQISRASMQWRQMWQMLCCFHCAPFVLCGPGEGYQCWYWRPFLVIHTSHKMRHQRFVYVHWYILNKLEFFGCYCYCAWQMTTMLRCISSEVKGLWKSECQETSLHAWDPKGYLQCELHGRDGAVHNQAMPKNS